MRERLRGAATAATFTWVPGKRCGVLAFNDYAGFGR